MKTVREFQDFRESIAKFLRAVAVLR